MAALADGEAAAVPHRVPPVKRIVRDESFELDAGLPRVPGIPALTRRPGNQRGQDLPEPDHASRPVGGIDDNA